MDDESSTRSLRRGRQAVVGAAVLAGLGAVGALGLPEAAIYWSGHEEWAYRAGREISLGALFLASMFSALAAWVFLRRPIVIAVLAAATFLVAAVGRDAVARGSQPAWCYADEVVVEDGQNPAVSTSGEYDGCTVLLPGPSFDE